MLVAIRPSLTTAFLYQDRNQGIRRRRAYTHTRTHAHTYTRTHAHEHAYTPAGINGISFFSLRRRCLRLPRGRGECVVHHQQQLTEAEVERDIDGDDERKST